MLEVPDGVRPVLLRMPEAVEDVCCLLPALEGVLCLLEVPEVMRCVPLRMLEAVTSELVIQKRMNSDSALLKPIGPAWTSRVRP